MHKSAFQVLKRTFMHVSGLPPQYFEKKNEILHELFFFSKSGGRRHETCINVRFRACLKPTFMHVLGLPPPNFDKKKTNL